MQLLKIKMGEKTENWAQPAHYLKREKQKVGQKRILIDILKKQNNYVCGSEVECPPVEKFSYQDLVAPLWIVYPTSYCFKKNYVFSPTFLVVLH